MAVMEQRTLRKLRDRLQADCSVLVHGTWIEVERDDGSITRQQIPGLVRQLASAIAKESDVEIARVRRSKGALPSVISVQAFDIMADIDRVSRTWNSARSIPIRIGNAVAEVCEQSIDAIPRMRSMSHYLDSWIRLISELFEPPRRIHLAGACPECGESHVRQYSMYDREYVIAPALQIKRDVDGHLCECHACGAVWPDTHFLLLAKVLGCESMV